MQNKNNLIIGVIVVVVIIILAVMATRGGDETPTPASDIGDTAGAATTTPDNLTVSEEISSTREDTPSATMAVRAFFGNKVQDPGSLDCGRVYPVTRQVSKTMGVARSTLNELLSGLTAAEMAEGYFSSLNTGVTLRSLTIDNGVARADFSSQLGESVGGSCRVAAIRAQITETLKQFPTVKSVIIGVNGNFNDEEILQP